jgi:hypothetical protein
MEAGISSRIEKQRGSALGAGGSDVESRPSEPRVTRPGLELLQSGGGQEVNVDPADPDARETVPLDQRERLLVLDDGRTRYGRQEVQDLGACGEAAAGEFRDHEVVTGDLPRLEGLFLEDEVEPDAAEEIRVAASLIRELGVNPAGAEVALQLRRRLACLEARMRELLEQLSDETDGR